jgi:hypothetical protein
MQNPFFTIFIFVVVLFLYIHITAAWKTSDDLEIYETDYKSAAQLQEVVGVKQPVLFQIIDPVVSEFVERFQVARFEKYDNIDICVKASADYRGLSPKSTRASETSVDAVPMSLRSARRLLTTDTNGKYFSERNHVFLEESGLDRLSHSVDTFLKPPLSAYSKHDILLGSAMVSTPLRYRLESHNYIVPTRGKIRVKMCPPKYGKILPTVADYENYEFVCPIDVWNPPSSPEEKDILSKIKLLEFEVFAGTVLYIPPYWWYSIRFSGDVDTTVAGFTYDAAMNALAQSKHWALFYLQQSNIKTKPAKTHIPAVDSAVDVKPEEEPALSSSASAPASQTKPHHTEIVSNAGIYKISSTADDS